MINDIMPPSQPRRPQRRIEPLPKPAAVPLREQARAIDPSFQTPEETAARDETIAAVVSHHDTTPKARPERARRFGLPAFSWPPTRKQSIISGALAVVLAFGIGAGWTLTHHKRAVVADQPQKVITKKVAPTPIYSTLTGLPVADASVNQKPVTAVMVENSIDARPQSGLGDAGVVFEAVAEGGVTRFMALYQDTAPTNVGPIRSARPYYISWALGFDAGYAHVGGSDAGLADIKAWGVRDLDQFYNGSSYHRISSRAAPHNVYTGIDTLNQLEASKGYTSSTYTGFARTSDDPYKAPAANGQATDSRTPATSINFSLSGPTYDPHFDYVAASNSYNRSEAGEPQTDANTGKQLSPKVVIAMVLQLGRGALDSSGAYYSDYTTTGSGTAYIFQNGTVQTGQWSKASNTAQLSFTDASGKVIPLNRGQTWISAVSATSAVSYK